MAGRPHDPFNDLEETLALPRGYAPDPDYEEQIEQLGLIDFLANFQLQLLTYKQSIVDFWLYAPYGHIACAVVVLFILYILLYFLSVSVFSENLMKNNAIHEKEECCYKANSRNVPEDFRLADLKQYDGSDGDKPIYIALKRKVYDVTTAAAYYGPTGTYTCFAGREATRAMAKLSFDEKDLTATGFDDLKQSEKDCLEGWVKKFKLRGYPIVGRVVD